MGKPASRATDNIFVSAPRRNADTRGRVRPHYEAFSGLARPDAARTDRPKAGRGQRAFHRVGITFAVYGEESDRAADSVRYRAAHHSSGRMEGAGSRPAPARERAQRVPARRLSRPEDSRSRRRAARARARQRPVPQGNAGHGRPGRHICAHCGRRYRPRGRGRLLRARGQPARAFGRVLHAREPPDDDAAFPRALCDAADPPRPALSRPAAREPPRASPRRGGKC